MLLLMQGSHLSEVQLVRPRRSPERKRAVSTTSNETESESYSQDSYRLLEDKSLATSRPVSREVDN